MSNLSVAISILDKKKHELNLFSFQNWYKRLRAIETMLINNRRRFNILQGTSKAIFTTSGNRAQFTGVEDDHKPFEKKGNIEKTKTTCVYETTWKIK